MLPQINNKADNVSMINQFAGINKNLYVPEGEFADMENMSTDNFPVFSNRALRGKILTMTSPMGVAGGKFLAYIDSNDLYYDFEKIADLDETDEERILVMMGSYLCVFPDGLIYNISDYTIQKINNSVTKASVKMTLCKIDGTAIDAVESDTEPSDKTKYWIDTSSDPVVIKFYSTNTAMWVSVGTTYVKFEAEGIGEGFKTYDAATFSGVDTYKTSSDLYEGWDFNQSNILYACDTDYVIVAGLINKTHTNSTDITIAREFPQMDFVCELNNRLWGCSSDNHEIYASKLGDPLNWNFFGGLDNDSYAVTVGTQNDFTGLAAYGGYLYAFKEDGYHKLYGTKPSNFEMAWKAGRGVQPGSEKSVCVVNEYLMYKARDQVCLYDGSVETIGDKLGNKSYYEAVAGAYRNKYYISMRDDDYNYGVYVYDITKGTWTKENGGRIKYMAYTSDGLYIVNDANELWQINQEAMRSAWFPNEETYPADDLYPGKSFNADMETNCEWSFETGDIGMESPNNKYLKRIDLRLMLGTGANVTIKISYDSSDEWKKLWSHTSVTKRTFELPIAVKRADHLRLKFSGKGDIKLYSIAKVTEEGSAT